MFDKAHSSADKSRACPEVRTYEIVMDVKPPCKAYRYAMRTR
jgi:hypothetical protein